jgi:hypothetical protein
MWKNFPRLMLLVGIGMTGAAQVGHSQPQPNYPNQQWNNNGGYGQQRYTTVTVTNRGQNGYADQVVQQQVPCGSQYYDGYRQRIAPQC